MKKIKLDKIENEILNSIDEYKSVLTKEDKKNYEEYASHTMKKSKSINIRISEKDLLELKRKSVESGIPYQTLISALIHKYNNNKIKIDL